MAPRAAWAGYPNHLGFRDAGDSLVSCPSTSIFGFSELAWEPRRSLEEIVASAHEWRKAHPDGHGPV